jgi:tetratricopeptide (TPR) repeat protein
MGNYLILFLLLLGIPMQGFSQKGSTKVIDKTEQGFLLVYQNRFMEADSLLRLNKKNFPGHYLNHILAANICWWRIMFGEKSEILDKTFCAEVDSGLLIMEKTAIERMSNDQLFLLLNFYGFRSRIYFRERAFLKAIQTFRGILSILKSTFGKEPEFERFYFTSALFHFYTGSGREYSNLIKAALLTFPPSDKMKGVEYLYKLVNSNDKIMKNESRYFLVKMSLDNLENFKESLRLAISLAKEYPTNALYQYYVFKNLVKLDRMEEARKEMAHLDFIMAENTQLKPEHRRFWKGKVQETLKRHYEVSTD